MADKSQLAFAVWVTGLPASGKSTLAQALKTQLAEQGVAAAELESDVLRRVLSDHPRYDQEGRDRFYRLMTYIGVLLTQHGVSVIFDATANRREYRNRARQQIPRFLEVYVSCPLEVCMRRDPKSLYKQAREGAAENVPGLQAEYEPPVAPDLIVQGDRDDPAGAARGVIAKLAERNYLPLTRE
ncbi:MAG TPA: adenylyl-sulfate kinase [Bryobacteraceae bacterium]|nr:adenylyl-sulfate kinase [Bryobacteraceae bacterium]